MPTARTNQPRRSAKLVRILRYLILAGALVGGLLLVLPYGAKHYLSRWLLDHGADSAIIEDIDFNPFTGRLRLEGVEVRQDGREVLGNSTIYLDLGLASLIDRELLVERSTLTDVVVEIERYPDGSLRFGSYRPDPSTDRTVAAEPDETGLPWIFGAREVVFDAVSLRYRQPGFELDLQLQSALLERFSTDPEDPSGRLQLTGTVNGTPIDLELNHLGLAGNKVLSGTITTGELDLNRSAGLLQPWVETLDGRVGLDGTFELEIDEGAGLAASYDGELKLAEIEAAVGDDIFSGGLDWQGEISFKQPVSDRFELAFNGSLALQEAAYSLPESKLKVSAHQLELTGKTELEVSETFHLTTAAGLELEELALSLETLEATQDRGSWQGELDYVQAAPEAARLDLDGSLQLAGIHLELPGSELDLAVEAADATGPVALELSPELQLDSEVGLRLTQVSGTVGELQFNQEDGSWKGSLHYRNQDNGPDLRTSGALELGTTELEQPDLGSLLQQRISLDGDLELNLDQPFQSVYSGTVAQQRLSYGGKAVRFETDSLDWNGVVAYEIENEKSELLLDGILRTDDSKLGFPAARFNLSLAALQLDSAGLRVDPAAPETVEGSAELTVKQAVAQQQAAEIAVVESLSAGPIHREDGAIRLDRLLTGNISLPASPSLPYEVAIDALELAALSLGGDLQQLNLEQVKLLKPRATDPQTATTVIRLNQISGNGALVRDLESYSLDSLTLETAELLTPGQAGSGTSLATLDRLKARKLNWNGEDGAVIDEIDLDGLQATLERPPSRQPEAPKAGTTEDDTETDAEDSDGPAPESPEAAESKDSQPRSLPLKIHRLSLGGESGLAFHDQSLSRPFSARLELQSLQAAGVDLSRPEQPFGFNLESKVNDYATLRLEGSAAPLAAAPHLEVQAELTNFPMSDLSPYLVDSIGTEFISGRLSLDTSLTLNGDQLEAENDLRLSDLKTRTADQDVAAEFNRTLPVPLDTAIYLLADEDRNLDLSIPLTGELNQISVGVGGVLTRSLSRAISTTVTPYLAYTVLGPTGALAFLAVEIGATLMDTDLPKVIFAPQSADLSLAQLEVLDRVGTRLAQDFAEDPEQTISVCARVLLSETGAEQELSDRTARQELFRLGDSRTETVKAYLIGAYDLDPSRLLDCSPTLIFDGAEAGSVEFMER